MKKYHIPTAGYEVFTDIHAAEAYVETCPIPTVIKADGLALGKGVIIAMTREEAIEGIKTIMAEHKFGHSGDQIVIEEFDKFIESVNPEDFITHEGHGDSK